MHKAVISIQFDSIKQAQIIQGSLLPELSKKIPQTSVSVIQEDNKLTISLSAKTTTILRAAFNSYSRWIQTALNVQQL